MQHPKPPMNNEKLSQLMDGEWHELNPSDCVAGACEDDALRAKWARYHLIRDVMKNEPLRNNNGLASRICSAIVDEECYSNITPFSASNAASNAAGQQAISANSASADTAVAKGRQTSVLNTGMMGLALAASVAAVTVVSTNIWQSPRQGEVAAGGLAAGSAAVTVAIVKPQTTTPVVNTSGAFARQFDGAQIPEVEFVSNTGSYWVLPQNAQRAGNEERLNMMASHHIANSPTADGLFPYSRLVGYEQPGGERE